jgi:hypothetical protein
MPDMTIDARMMSPGELTFDEETKEAIHRLIIQQDFDTMEEVAEYFLAIGIKLGWL